jgi:hypothetical protein
MNLIGQRVNLCYGLRLFYKTLNILQKYLIFFRNLLTLDLFISERISALRRWRFVNLLYHYDSNNLSINLKLKTR